jgi:hypothetical protein
MPAYSHFDYYLRSVTTAVLACVVLGVAAYQVVSGATLAGPFVNWAGIIVGVYFGSHISLNGSGARRRLASEQASGTPAPPTLPPSGDPV